MGGWPKDGHTIHQILTSLRCSWKHDHMQLSSILTYHHIEGLPCSTPLHWTFQFSIPSRCQAISASMSPIQFLNLDFFLVIKIHISPYYVKDHMNDFFFTCAICCKMTSLRSSHGVKMKGFHYLPRCFFFQGAFVFFKATYSNCYVSIQSSHLMTLVGTMSYVVPSTIQTT